MSIQQRIASDVYRMAEKAVTPEQIKSIQAHLVKSVQTGAVPSYVGIPLLNDLNQKMARIQTAPAQAQAMVQQPPLAQQVMGQAEQGVETLPSGLPEQAMAGGGIIAFAGGGMSDYEMASQLLDDEDDEDQDYVSALLGDIYSREAASATEEGDDDADALMATMARESVSMKQGDQPARGVTRERTSVTGPAGLEGLLKMIEQKESGGRDYDKYGRLLTSPAGAQGRMQVMPGTARDPGFGIRPAREGDVEDLARVGREYYTALLDKYQDPKVAAIAYNWGPGNTDKWLSSGAGIDKLPRETRNYVANMREGGIARFQNTGIVTLDQVTNDPDSWRSRSSSPEVRAAEPKGGYKDITKMTPEEIKEAARRRIKMEGARAAVPSAAAAPTATPAAPAAKAGLGALGSGFLGALGLGGAGLTLGAGNQMRNLSQEQREQLTGDIGSDTGFAAAIMNAAKPAEPTKPAGVATLPTVPRMPVTSSNTLGQSYKRTAGATKEDIDNAELLTGVDFGGPGSSPATLTPPEPEATKEAAPKEESGIRGILDKFRADIGKQRDIDNYLSLLSSGLGMMGGTSPFAAVNIGQGALQGVKTYQQAAQQRSADERGLLSAELGLKKYEQLGDIRRAQIEAQKAKGVEDQDIKRARLAQSRLNTLNETAGKIEELAGKAVDATGKLATTEMLGKSQAEIAALKQQEINKMLMGNSPMAMRYKAIMKELGYDLGGFGAQGGNTMSPERASKFKVER